MTQNTCNVPCVPCMDEDACEPMNDGCFVPAGDVCEADCPGFDVPSEDCLAAICFQDQVYRTGFCPAEALQNGTLFPELVRPYTTRGC